MSEEERDSALWNILNRGYRHVFEEQWSIMTGGLLIGIMSILTFAWARPWGVAGGLRNWGDWLFHLVGAYEKTPFSPLLSTSSILSLGLLWGAFGAALMARQFAFRMAPPLELVKGIVGGSLMGIGAAMAGGCNVGGFYSAVSALSLGGIMMMFGLIAGAVLGLKYLYWELEHLPSGHSGSAAEVPERDDDFDWRRISPYLGLLVLLAAFGASWIYKSYALTRIGGLLLFGVAFGMILQRSRFCFVRAFRDPFMTGEGGGVRAVSLSVLISVIGFAVLKWTGLRDESVYITSTFWFGSLVGGFIFGFGMLLSGGCGSGSVWRAGEGQVKLMLAVFFLSLSNSLFKSLINSSEFLSSLMGRPLYLPDYLTYLGAVTVLVLFFGAYYVFATWNEETEKAIIEM